MTRRALDAALGLSHLTLLAAVSIGLARAELGGAVSGNVAVRAVLVAAGAAPLVLAIPGLYRGRRYTFRWLALALVAYAGLAATEVVASLGTSVAASIALLAALIELGLLLSRSGTTPPRATRE